LKQLASINLANCKSSERSEQDIPVHILDEFSHVELALLVFEEVKFWTFAKGHFKIGSIKIYYKLNLFRNIRKIYFKSLRNIFKISNKLYTLVKIAYYLMF
jgi:hypothetical protein